VVRKYIAEFLGTGLLVFFGVGVATLMFGFHFDGGSVAAGVVATALAFGLILLALAYAIGPLSGCHVNPAVTMGALLARRLSARDAVGYWAAQFAGGILGALLLWGMFNTSPLYKTSSTGLGTNGWGAASAIHIGMGGAFLAEVVLTAMFVFVILAVTSKAGNAVTAGLVIGLALTVAHLVGIPITGTSVNPARSLGPALIVGGTALNQVWLFIVAPLVGGAVAAGVYYLVFPREGLAKQPAAASPGRRRLPGQSIRSTGLTTSPAFEASSASFTDDSGNGVISLS
jgi:aquaporin Z